MTILSTHRSLHLSSQHLDLGDTELGYVTLRSAILDSVKRKENRHINSKPWYDRECRIKQREALWLLHLIKNGQPEIKFLYCKTRREYKSLLKAKQESHNKKIETAMLQEAEELPWKALPRKHAPGTAPIPLRNLEKHFQGLLNPSNRDPIFDIHELLYVEDIHLPYNRPFTLWHLGLHWKLQHTLHSMIANSKART